jgi:hypothetical protein
MNRLQRIECRMKTFRFFLAAACFLAPLCAVIAPAPAAEN